MSDLKSMSIRLLDAIKEKPLTSPEILDLFGRSAQTNALPRLIKRGCVVRVKVFNSYNPSDHKARTTVNEYRWTGEEYEPARAIDNLEAGRKRQKSRATERSESGLISTSELCERLGFKVSVEFIQRCGILPAHHEEFGKHRGYFWNTVDFPHICAAIEKHLRAIVRDKKGFKK